MVSPKKKKKKTFTLSFYHLNRNQSLIENVANVAMTTAAQNRTERNTKITSAETTATTTATTKCNAKQLRGS